MSISGFGAWGSSPSSADVSGYGFGDWQNRFPNENRTGTENPTNDAERTRRISHLENEIYKLRDIVRNADSKVDEARNRVDRLENRLSQLRNQANEWEGKYNRLNNEQGGLEGKQAAIREKRRNIEERMRANPNDPYLKAEWQQLDNERWQIVDELGRVTDQKNNANDKRHEYFNAARETDYELNSARNAVDERIRDRDTRKQQLAQFEDELRNLKAG